MSEVNEGEKILKTCRTVAVVGLSPKSERASLRIAAHLKEQGYRIVPVTSGGRRYRRGLSC